MEEPEAAREPQEFLLAFVVVFSGSPSFSLVLAGFEVQVILVCHNMMKIEKALESFSLSFKTAVDFVKKGSNLEFNRVFIRHSVSS